MFYIPAANGQPTMMFTTAPQPDTTTAAPAGMFPYMMAIPQQPAPADPNAMTPANPVMLMSSQGQPMYLPATATGQAAGGAMGMPMPAFVPFHPQMMPAMPGTATPPAGTSLSSLGGVNATNVMGAGGVLGVMQPSGAGATQGRGAMPLLFPSATGNVPSGAPGTPPSFVPSAVSGGAAPPTGGNAPPSYEAVVLDPNGPRSQTNLFIRKLASAVTEKDIQALCEPYGQVISFALMRDIHTGESLGTAFVRFEEHREAKAAMEALDGTELYGRPISIQWAKKQHDGTPVGEARRKIHKVFVRNIPLSVTGKELRLIFTPYGSISNITVHADTAPMTNNSNNINTSNGETGMPAVVPGQRNIAFIVFNEDGSAEYAVRALHNTCPFESCEGIPLMVKLAEDNRQRLERKIKMAGGSEAGSVAGTPPAGASLFPGGSPVNLGMGMAGIPMNMSGMPNFNGLTAMNMNGMMMVPGGMMPTMNNTGTPTQHQQQQQHQGLLGHTPTTTSPGNMTPPAAPVGAAGMGGVTPNASPVLSRPASMSSLPVSPAQTSATLPILAPAGAPSTSGTAAVPSTAAPTATNVAAPVVLPPGAIPVPGGYVVPMPAAASAGPNAAPQSYYFCPTPAAPAAATATSTTVAPVVAVADAASKTSDEVNGRASAGSDAVSAPGTPVPGEQATSADNKDADDTTKSAQRQSAAETAKIGGEKASENAAAAARSANSENSDPRTMTGDEIMQLIDGGSEGTATPDKPSITEYYQAHTRTFSSESDEYVFGLMK